MTATCPLCTLENDAGAVSCAACGGALEVATSALEMETSRAPAPSKPKSGQRSILEALGAAPKELGRGSQ